MKWVEVENLHVTLLFLGEVDERELPPLCRAVSVVCGRHDRFDLSVETVGCFPNPRRPRVVWAGVGMGGPELVALHDALEPPLLELGCYRREERQYTPHITLGRVKSDRSRRRAGRGAGEEGELERRQRDRGAGGAGDEQPADLAGAGIYGAEPRQVAEAVGRAGQGGAEEEE